MQFFSVENAAISTRTLRDGQHVRLTATPETSLFSCHFLSSHFPLTVACCMSLMVSGTSAHGVVHG